MLKLWLEWSAIEYGDGCEQDGLCFGSIWVGDEWAWDIFMIFLIFIYYQLYLSLLYILLYLLVDYKIE